ncbi:MAG: glycosyltransferase family 2 protein [Planctomycetaceae bacterium]|nr:glycosyltransferase family 2 protein [Planctomycetaceae bacterium]
MTESDFSDGDHTMDAANLGDAHQTTDEPSPPDQVRPFSQDWHEHLKLTIGEVACQQLGFYAIPDHITVSVVIPVYNEEATLEKILDRVCAVPILKEIVLVDDYSIDDSAKIIESLKEKYSEDPLNTLKSYNHSRNRGKGAAIRTGFENVTGDIVIIQDADLEYDPSEYPRLIQPIVEGRADVVYGSRFLGDKPHRVLYYWHYLGNKFLTMLSNCFTNLNLTDMETCFKIFRREAIQDMLPTLKQDRFGIEPEITAKIARRNYRIYEMSTSYSGRTYDQGKKIGWRDGFKALYCIVRYGFAD